MKKVTLNVMLFSVLFFASCGGNEGEQSTENNSAEEVKTEEVADQTETTEEEIIEEEIESNDNSDSKGVGPISSIELGDIDEALVEEGKELYKANCTACHKMGKRFVGPALQGVTERRTPEWIMNMILNPEGMVAEDPIAMELLAEYSSPMANQSLTEEDARAVLEFFRTKN